MKKMLLSFVIISFLVMTTGCANLTSATTSKTTKKEDITTINKTTNKLTEEIITTTKREESMKDDFDVEAINKSFSERREYLINYFVKNYSNTSDQKWGFGAQAIKILLYEETGDEKYLKSALLGISSCYDSFMKSGNCFGATEATMCYGLFNKYFDDELLTKAQNAIKSSKTYGEKPDTPNHTLLSGVGAYLANQWFPGEVKTPYLGYMNTDSDDADAKKAVEYVLTYYQIYGMYEFNSDTYYICHFKPLLALALLADDESVRTRAMMILEDSLFSLAPVWLNGHLCCAQERTYTPYAAQNKGGGTTMLLWYYFGGDYDYPTKAEMNYCEAYALGYMIYSSFRPDILATLMATDRETSYSHKEMHIANNKRNSTYFINYLKTEMHEDYSVFSTKTQIKGADYLKAYGDHSDMATRYGNYRQLLNWGVRWKADSASDFSTFSIQHVNQIDDDRETKFGSSCYSQVFQYEDTVIGVFDVPEDYIYPSLLILEPNNYKAIIDESYLGRVYLHYGNVIIAYQLSVNFTNQIVEETKVRTSPITKAWFVCEVIDASEIDGDTPIDQLYYVQSLLEGNFKKIKSELTNKPYVEYKNVNGHVLSMQFGGNEQNTNETVDGILQVYDINTYPMQENPFIKQNYKDKVYTYTYKNHSVTFDYNNFKIIRN